MFLMSPVEVVLEMQMSLQNQLEVQVLVDTGALIGSEGVTIGSVGASGSIV